MRERERERETRKERQRQTDREKRGVRLNIIFMLLVYREKCEDVYSSRCKRTYVTKFKTECSYEHHCQGTSALQSTQ